MKPSLDADASPEAYGEAMVLCQGYAPACSNAQECGLDDWCFGKDGRGYARARQQIKKLIENEREVFTRAFLKSALDALDHHQFCVKAADALRIVQMNRRVRELYGLDSSGKPL